MLVAPRKVQHLLVFGWMMGYIGATHAYRMYTDWLGYRMDFSGPQMMATIKITSAAWNYFDGKQGRTEDQRAADLKALDVDIKAMKEKQKTGLSKEEKAKFSQLRVDRTFTNLALDALPGPLEFYGWVHNFSTYQAGPALEIREYLNVNNGVTTIPGGCVAATAKHFVVGIACLGSHMVLNGYFPLCPDPAAHTANTAGSLSNAFLEKNFFERMWFNIMASLAIQTRYFMAWKLGEAAATSFGYGANVDSKTGEAQWDGCQNIDLKTWLTCENMSAGSKAWNQKTQNWLQTYVYFRVPVGRVGKLLSTYAVSAYWHGFYPGYYITFFLLGMGSVVQDQMILHVRPLFNPEDEAGLLKRVYNVMGFITMMMVKTFAALPFLLSTAENAFEVEKRQYFFFTICMVVGLAFCALPPPKKKNSKPKEDVKKDK